jgi:hypothetical protein
MPRPARVPFRSAGLTSTAVPQGDVEEEEEEAWEDDYDRPPLCHSIPASHISPCSAV